MIASHIHHALAQVRALQQNILEKQRFKGYSGRARAMAGSLALGGTLVMSAPFYPQTTDLRLLGWGIILMLSLFLNYGALVHWFLFDPEVKRDLRRLKPVIDGVPPLLVGAVLTVVLLRHDHVDYLFGMWLAMFGLANLASRHVLPRGIGWLGLVYLGCGSCGLLTTALPFSAPLSLGLILFFGELAGGTILHLDGKVDRGRNDLYNWRNMTDAAD